MAELDITFRRLLRDLPQPLIHLAFPQRTLAPLGPLDPSVDRTRKLTTDNMLRAIEGSTEVIVHVEVERDWRPKLADRLFDYASAAVTATRLPVWSVVVLLRPGGRPPEGTGVYRVPGADGDAFVFRYQVVPLWQLDAREMQAQLGPAGAPFCAAMRGADEAFIRELVAEVQAHPGLAPRDRQSTIQLLYIVSAVILGSDTARRIFHVESIIQDPNVQALIREWEDKGRAEGRAEGHAEGRTEGHAEGRTEGHAEGRTEGHAEGRAEEARSLLLKVLRARSLPVTADVRARIDAEADLARLESWLEAAVTATALGDVFRDS